MMLRLFFNPLKKRYYFVPKEPQYCYECGKIIERAILFDLHWGKKKSSIQFYCIDCIPRIKNPATTAIVHERYLAVILPSPPVNAYPVFINSPNLVSGQESSVFDAAQPGFRGKDNYITNDKTIYAGRRPETIDFPARMKELQDHTRKLNQGIASREEAGEYLRSLQIADTKIKKPLLRELRKERQ